MISKKSVQQLTGIGLLWAAVAASSLSAQGNWGVVKATPAGTEVQVKVEARTIRGTVDKVTDDTLVVTSGKGQEVIERQRVAAVAVKKASHRKRNVLIGLAVGAGGGLGVGLASRSKSGQLKIVSNGAVEGGCTAAGAVVGAIIGAVIPTGGWREIYKK